ncbi:hypothetical protein LIA77_08601 [Sarocladium implicatum]|nr:hypothetical protein LIA77_08601 [Sarocladium implicatum]
MLVKATHHSRDSSEAPSALSRVMGGRGGPSEQTHGKRRTAVLPARLNYKPRLVSEASRCGTVGGICMDGIYSPKCRTKERRHAGSAVSGRIVPVAKRCQPQFVSIVGSRGRWCLPASSRVARKPPPRHFHRGGNGLISEFWVRIPSMGPAAPQEFIVACSCMVHDPAGGIR